MNCPVKSGQETNYDLCITCSYIGKKCNGPNLSVISTSRWCEWIRLLKEHLHWNNAQISDLSGVSLPTVNRVMSGAIGGLTVETKYRISYAMIFQRSPGEDPAKYPCAMVALGLPSDTDLSAIIQENKELKSRLEDNSIHSTVEYDTLLQRYNELKEQDRVTIDYLKQQITFKESQMVEKDTLLRERAEYLRLKDRYIAILFCLFGIAMLAIIFALAADWSNPEIGFFWRDALSAFVP